MEEKKIEVETTPSCLRTSVQETCHLQKLHCTCSFFFFLYKRSRKLVNLLWLHKHFILLVYVEKIFTFIKNKTDIINPILQTQVHQYLCLKRQAQITGALRAIKHSQIFVLCNNTI